MKTTQQQTVGLEHMGKSGLRYCKRRYKVYYLKLDCECK